MTAVKSLRSTSLSSSASARAKLSGWHGAAPPAGPGHALLEPFHVDKVHVAVHIDRAQRPAELIDPAGSRNLRARVARVAHPVAIGVVLYDRMQHRAVVARVAEAVLIGIGLGYVPHTGAVIARIADVVAVAVRLGWRCNDSDSCPRRRDTRLRLHHLGRLSAASFEPPPGKPPPDRSPAATAPRQPAECLPGCSNFRCRR